MFGLKNVGAKRRPVNLFFTELIIALLFFSVSGAVLLKLFAAADKKARLSSIKENAMVCARSLAEAFSVSGSAEEAFAAVFEEAPGSDGDGKYTIKLDKLCKADAGGLVTLVAAETRSGAEAGETASLSMIFSSENEELFSLDCSAYIPKGGGDA